MRGLFCLIIGIAAVGCRTMPDTTWVEHALAQQELEEGKTENAIMILEDCKRRSPDYAMTYLTLAAAWARQGDTDKFRENIETYLALNPSHHVAGLYLGEAQFKQHRYDQAKKTFQAYLTAEKGSDSKSLEHRYHALARLAEIAENENNDLDRHLYLGRALHQQALSELARPTDAGVSEETRVAICDSLTFALEELLEARELSKDTSIVDREVAAVTSLREDVEEGRADKISLLLTSTSSMAASGQPSKDRYRNLLAMSPLSGLALPTPKPLAKTSRSAKTSEEKTSPVETTSPTEVTPPKGTDEHAKIEPLPPALPEETPPTAAVDATEEPSPTPSSTWKSTTRQSWLSPTAN